MVQVRTCVSVHCDQCGQALGRPGFEEHYPSEDAALAAALADGWVQGPGERWWCSCCGPVLVCETEGHEFTAWQPGSAGGGYRYCRVCCLHETRPGPAPGESAGVAPPPGVTAEALAQRRTRIAADPDRYALTVRGLLAGGTPPPPGEVA